MRLAAALALALLAAACAQPAATPLLPPASATPTPAAQPLLPPGSATPTLDPLDADLATVGIDVGRGRFTAVVVDTPALRARGLSGRDALAQGRAMWFDMGVEAPATFWMRGMRFPIDIVWVDAGLRVVHVTHEAPVPPEGASDAELPRYTPGAVDVRYVLEINAGLARELGIEPGARVTLATL